MAIHDQKATVIRNVVKCGLNESGKWRGMALMDGVLAHVSLFKSLMNVTFFLSNLSG